MGFFDFMKSAGRAVGIGGDEPPKPEDLRQEVDRLGLDVLDLDIQVEGGTVKVSGKTMSQADRERIVLALGNVQGVEKVEESIQVEQAAAAPAGESPESPGAAAGPPPEGGAESRFYTVKSGDTLSSIAKAEYGDAGKYPAIFEANRPMLDAPDRIYPGQVLRIPPNA